jgi:glutathione S-transferase
VETLAALESERALRSTPFWLGQSLSHADIAFACGYRFTSEAHPGLIEPNRFPSLTAQAARCESLVEFQRVDLPITNNLERA